MPSHVRVSTVEAPAHIEQDTLVPAIAHIPAPAQYPSLPHTLPGSIGQSSGDGTMTGAHCPSVPPVSAPLQAIHSVSQRALQQTPSTQCPLPHSMFTEHGVPLPPPVDALEEAVVVAAVVVDTEVDAVEVVVDTEVDAVEVVLEVEVVEVEVEVDALEVDTVEADGLEVVAPPEPDTIAPEGTAPLDVEAAPPALPSSNASKS